MCASGVVRAPSRGSDSRAYLCKSTFEIRPCILLLDTFSGLRFRAEPGSGRNAFSLRTFFSKSNSDGRNNAFKSSYPLMKQSVRVVIKGYRFDLLRLR